MLGQRARTYAVFVAVILDVDVAVTLVVDVGVVVTTEIGVLSTHVHIDAAIALL